MDNDKCAAMPCHGAHLTRTSGNGKSPAQERAIIRGTARPGPPRPSSHRDPLPIAVSCRFIARLPVTRLGARHAENLPRPGALAASGGGSDKKEKILSPELAPIGRERSQVCLRQDPLR